MLTLTYHPLPFPFQYAMLPSMPAPLFTPATSREAQARKQIAKSPIPREQQANTLREQAYKVAVLAYPKLVKALRTNSKSMWELCRVWGVACDKVLAGSEGQGITITIPSVVLERLTTMTRPVDTAKGITVTTGISNTPAQLEGSSSKRELT